jgi:hypothetical protein
VYNSFLNYANTTDVKIEFDGEAYFEVLDPDTGEASYLIIDALIGRETDKKPETGAIVLKEEKVGEEEGTLFGNRTEKEEGTLFSFSAENSLWDTDLLKEGILKGNIELENDVEDLGEFFKDLGW